MAEQRNALPSAWAQANPKADTQAAQFLAAHPEYDGRGVKVAILDTGVDPGAIGLQTCPDGRPKVIDIVDGTGSGDVDMSKEVAVSDKFEVIGLTGRTLKLGANWGILSGGKVRIGIKRAFELFPGKLVSRVKAARKKEWLKKHRVAESEAQHAIVAWDEANPKPKPEEKKEKENLEALLKELQEYEKSYDDPGPVFDCVVYNDGAIWRAVIDLKETGDLVSEKRMTNYKTERQYATFGEEDLMNYCVNIYDDGKVLSIVCDAGAHGSHVASITAAYHPDQPEQNGVAPGAQIVAIKIGDSRLGSMETGVGLVRALMHVRENGCDLINLSYGEASSVHNYGRFVELATELVDKEGVIFVSSAGNNGPALSTVGAPGGSSTCCIGVGAAVMKSMMGVQYSLRDDGRSPNTLYNWSSVGPSLDGDFGVDICAPGGAITSVPNWTLNKHQLMNGTSMSSPNACGCIALVLSGLKQQQPPLKFSPYQIRDACKHTANVMMEQYGKQRAISRLIQGAGMIQVLDLYNHLTGALPKTIYSDDGPINYKVSCNRRIFNGGSARGVYIREAKECVAPLEINVSITPVFHEDMPQKAKVGFEKFVFLQVFMNDEAEREWVKCPRETLLAAQGRSFNILVDPTRLPAGGGVYTATVRGFDASTADGVAAGGDLSGLPPLFEVPVTVVKPGMAAGAAGAVDMSQYESELEQGGMQCGEHVFTAGERWRHFVSVPNGATWCDVIVEGIETNAEASASASKGDGENTSKTPLMMVLHCLQLHPHLPYRDHELKNYMRLAPGSTEVFTYKVTSGVTMEVCLSQFWSQLGACGAKMRVVFHSLSPDRGAVTLHGGDHVEKVVVTSHIRPEMLEPKVKCSKWQQKLRPKESVIVPLTDRDVWLNNRQIYRLMLTYEFKQTEAGDVAPLCPAVNGLLYDSPFEAQLLMAFDSEKKYLGTCDAWPRDNKIKVPKGTCTIRMEVRHDDVGLLEPLKDMCMLLERPIKGGDKSFSVFPTHAAAITGGGTLRTTKLRPGQSFAMFIAEPLGESVSKLFPADASPGDILTGSFTLGKKSDSAQGGGQVPGGYPFKYVIPPKPKKKDEKKSDGGGGSKEKELTITEAIRDLKVKRLVALQGKDKSKSKDQKEDKKEGEEEKEKEEEEEEDPTTFDSLFDEIVTDYPDHLPLIQSKLHHLDALYKSESKGKDDADADADAKVADVEVDSPSQAERLQLRIDAADAVIALIDQKELAAHFGVKLRPDHDGDKDTRKKMDKQKTALIDALTRKSVTLCESVDLAGENDGDGDEKGKFDAAYEALQQWADTKDDKYASLYLKSEETAGRTGTVLSKLRKLKGLEKSALPKDLTLKQVHARTQQLYEAQGWGHMAAYEDRWSVLNSPAAYALF